MMRTKLTMAFVSQALPFIFAGSYFLTRSEDIQATEKKKYTRPAFASFSSQMPDALLGSDKYQKPVWNLHDTLNLPDWLSLSVEQRTRYETMDGGFKANSSSGDQQIPLQTDVWIQAKLGSFRLGAEFLDARALDADSGSGVNNTHADTADFIQGYVAWANQNLFYTGVGTEIIVGRQTLNFGSRRLVARNAFRNTINSFSGARLRLLNYDNWQFNGFVVMPVQRLPNSSNEILNDIQQFDEENTHTLFSGGILEWYKLFRDVNADIYLYHLDEGDNPNHPSRNRRYFTPGFRFYIKPAAGDYDFQWETSGQFGTVRASTAATDNQNLNHEAWFQHLDIGYTFDIPWSPRMALEYDYASGDQNPNDNDDGRFDTLYGARRFEYGPTGIYGAFARSNINSPGYVIKISPCPDLQASLNHRVFWLASNTDSWTTAELRDKSGHISDYIGHQLELTARWNFNSSLNFETGWAHLFKGAFAKQAASAPNPMDVDYFYIQSLLRF